MIYHRDSSISGNDSKIRTIKSLEEIKSINNISDKAKVFLNSVFKELDTINTNGFLEKEEGAIYVFDDGAISVTKNNKLYAGMTKNGSEVRVKEDCLITKFYDGAESTMKDDKLVAGKSANGNEYTVKDGIITSNNPIAKVKQTENNNNTEIQQSKESAKSAIKTDKPQQKSSKINGIEKEQLDKIANEYLAIVKSPDSDNNFLKKIKDKKSLCKKYLRVFKKAINSPLKSYNFKDIETDKYIMHFSPVLDMYTNKYYWELYDVETKH